MAGKRRKNDSKAEEIAKYAIWVENVNKVYKDSNVKVALVDVDIKIKPGEFVFIVG